MRSTMPAGTAGLDVKDIDGFSGWCDDATLPAELALSLGTPNFRYSGLVWGGRGSGLPGAVTNAYMAVANGMADYVVVVRSIIQAKRLGQSWAAGVTRGEPIPVSSSYTVPFGMALPAGLYAPKARRHMALYGTTIDHFAEVTINARRNAANNPDARFRTEITMEDHHNSRLIADPIRLLDCCMESDGAAAVIVTSPERARDLRHPPIRIRAVSMTHEYKWGNGGWGTIDETFASTGHRRAAEQLYQRAGLGPDDVDVALFYDAFTPGGDHEPGGLEASARLARAAPSWPMGTSGGRARSLSTPTAATWPRSTSRA